MLIDGFIFAQRRAIFQDVKNVERVKELRYVLQQSFPPVSPAGTVSFTRKTNDMRFIDVLNNFMLDLFKISDSMRKVQKTLPPSTPKGAA